MHRLPPFKIPAACGTAAILDRTGRRSNVEALVRGMSVMFERGNGLGAGFAAYGIYPGHADCYALHLMAMSVAARERAGEYLRTVCQVVDEEAIPTRPTPTIADAPVLWRYFVRVPESKLDAENGQSEEDYVVALVMYINQQVEGAYVASSGKNMGVFKGVGYPEPIAEFYRLDEYQGHLWISHTRFPTNTGGWWGGAHPFGLLEWSIVHNGELSSYGVNKRYVEQFGYACTLFTDSEVINYMFDLLARKHRLGLEMACLVMAAPEWEDIDREPEAKRRERLTTLRAAYAGALLNGPFAVLVGFAGGVLGFCDRLKLRPLTAAEKGDRVYLASEESAIWAMDGPPDRSWPIDAGKPVVFRLEEEKVAALAHTG